MKTVRGGILTLGKEFDFRADKEMGLERSLTKIEEEEVAVMAVKKTELFNSLWASSDALRGGMDASQYRDCILTLLFLKYVTDKYIGQKYGDLTVFNKENDHNLDPDKRTGFSFDDFIALKYKKSIGEGIDKIIFRQLF